MTDCQTLLTLWQKKANATPNVEKESEPEAPLG